MTGEWRKRHNEELNYQYSSPNDVRVTICSMRGGDERRIQGFGGET
jgi:hypothetical protein